MKLEVSGIDAILKKFNTDNLKGMMQSIVQEVSNNVVMINAKFNAPVRTGNLRRSLSTDFSQLSRSLAKVYSDVDYAGIRELENNLHPSTKYYLKRGLTEHLSDVDSIFARQFKAWF